MNGIFEIRVRMCKVPHITNVALIVFLSQFMWGYSAHFFFFFVIQFSIILVLQYHVFYTNIENKFNFRNKSNNRKNEIK